MPTDAQRDWIARVFGIHADADGRIAPADGGATDRLATVQADAVRLGMAGELAEPMRQAAAAVADGRADAPDLVDALEQRVAAAATRARTAAAGATIDRAAPGAEVGVVALGRMRVGLARARSSHGMARTNLATACADLLNTPALVADPRSRAPATLAALAKVADRVPDLAALSETVDDALDALGNADPAGKAAARRAAGAAIAGYRRQVEADPLLAFMQHTAAGTYAIRDALVDALDLLDEALAA